MRTLILGPPGTGKTTTLLNIVENYLAQGIPADRIAFVSFTKAAAAEAAERAEERGFKKPRWFCTLHSMAYHLTGRPAVMGFPEYRDLEDVLGYKISRRPNVDEPISKGEVIKHVEEQARCRLEPIVDVARKLAPDVNHFQITQYAETLAKYKVVHAVKDFTDMLSDSLSCDPVDVDVFIVDEAQDLTALQWDAVETLCPSHADIYYAGDDDQTIHGWAGACITRFLALGEKVDEIKVLDKSYRLPSKIHEYANRLVSRVSARYEKEWVPRGEGGEISRVSLNALDRLPMNEGQWMLLARNHFNLKVYTQMLERRGILFTVNGKLAHEDILTMITNWERMRRGEELTGRQIGVIYKKGLGESFTPVKGKKYGIDDMPTNKVWHEALKHIPVTVTNYLQRVFRNGEKPSAPRVRVSTIHGCKGQECENVVVLSDISHASRDEMLTDPDNEHRVFYVAVTRAKEHLYLVNPNGEVFYPWLGN